MTGLAVATLAIAASLVWTTRAAAVPSVKFDILGEPALPSEQLRGRVTLVNFWATTCSVCMREMPQLVETYRALHVQGFDVVAVAMPYDRPDWVLEYSQRKQLPFKVALDPEGKVSRAFGGIEATPTSFLVDMRGRVVKRFVGAPDFGDLRRAIETELSSK